MKKIELIILALTLIVGVNAQGETLEEAVSFALNTNPSILISINQRLASDQSLRQAEAGYYPRLDLIGSIAREHSRNPTLEDIPNAPDSTFTSSEARIAAVQNLFEGFRTVNEVSKNRALVHSKAFQVNSNAQDTTLQVTQAYLDVIRGQRLVKLAKANLATHQQTYVMTKHRRKSGLSDAADLAQAAGRLALANSSLANEQKNLEIAKNNYLQVVGKLPGKLSMPTILPALIPKNKQETINLSLENNPFLKSAKEEVTVAQKAYQVSKASNYPVLDLELAAGRNKNINGVAGSYQDDIARLRGYYNIYRGGGDLAHQREAAYLVQAAQENKNLTEREIQQSASQAWVDYVTAKEQIPYLKKHKMASKESSILYQKQFKIGQRTLLDVLNSQNEHYLSSVAYENGIFNKLVSQYKILNNLGKLTESMGINLPQEANVS